MSSCSICTVPYNSAEKRPVVGTCGHTFCFSCSTSFNAKCPSCRENSFANPRTNYDLLELLKLGPSTETTTALPSFAQVPAQPGADGRPYRCWNCFVPLSPHLPIRTDGVSVKCPRQYCGAKSVIGRLEPGNKWMHIGCGLYKVHFQQLPVHLKKGDKVNCKVCGKKGKLWESSHLVAVPT